MSRKREDGLVRLALLILAFAALVFFAYLWVNGRNKDVSNPNVEFKPPPKRSELQIREETFVWPIYGFKSARTRDLPTRLSPPFKPVWRFNANQLLEFSPI